MTTLLVIMTVDPMKLSSPIMEDDQLDCSLPRKTSFSGPFMATALVQDLKGIPLPKGFQQVAQ